LLAQATREDQTGVPATGAQLAEQARGLFQQLKTVEGTAARAGDERAAVEYMFALQRSHDFSGCRSFAERLRAQPSMRGAMDRYPWIEAVDELTEKVCDDTPEGRIAGRKLQEGALHLAEANGYDLLGSRIHMRMVDDAQDARDLAMAEHLTLTTLRKLEDADAPTIRIIDAVATMSEIENDTPRKHTGELYLRETLDWQALIGSHARKALLLTELARAQTRMDAMKDAERSLRLAQQEADASGMKGVQSNLLRESEIFLAQAMLERGDLSRAARYLDLASSSIDSFSDIWALRTYAGARGQLALARGDLKGAAYALEQQIHSSEGENVHTGDRTSRAEYGEQDHDLYAELAATWLAQGRSPESVLALWERFRMRARGLPITQCAQGTWDCEQLRLVEAQHRLGSSVLIGQIVLLDRVLLYRADRYGVTWTVKPMRRQELLDAAQALETAASSPLTTTEVAEQLGASLSLHLLPALPSAQQMGNTILLEADPMLANLAWPVLPTPAGPLGLTYPVAEVRSILAETSGLAEPSTVARAVSMDRGTSRRAVALSYKLGNSSEGGRALVIGASVADGDMAPLPEAMAEATAVSRYEHAPDLLLGEQATTAHVAAAIGSATLLHFAGHAVQDGNGTQLLLAAASPTEKTPWIDGAFLLKHPPRVCKLAVLSACATGKREASWNRPLQDIVETLRSLGVPEVVATRWQIDSGAAVPFMKAFYGSVAAGNTVAVALTAARKLQSAQSHDNHPYYWAAYYVTGQETTHLGGELHASF
jgi:tetratricopeptide (TPR) repeat protein